MVNAEEVVIESKKIRYGMSIDEWWELFNNTGFKGMLMELSSERYELLKKEFYLKMLQEAKINGEIELVADSYFVLVR